MPKPKLFLFDANSFCYRAFFAIKANLSTSYGQPTGAIYGFLNILNKILKENKPDYIAICFDVSRDTFRKEIFTDYKGKRAAMPQELVSQIAIIKEIMAAYNFFVLEKEGFEADDLIATIAKKAENRFEVFVVSADKDMLQLVSDNIKIYNPYHEHPVMDKSAVLGRFGIAPEQIVDMVALAGDAIDNIPGVKGIGEKTALDLVKKYASVNNLLARLDEVLPARIRDMLKEQKENVSLSRRLAALDTEVPLDLDFGKFAAATPDYGSLRRVFKKMEFRKLLKDLPEEPKGATTQIAAERLIGPADIRQFIDRIITEKEMVFFPVLVDDGIAEIYFYQENKNYVLGPEFYPGLKGVFSGDNIQKIGHNLKQAKVALAKYGIKLCGPYFDTMLAAYILNPAEASFELEDIAAGYLDSGSSGAPLVSVIPELHKVLAEKLAGKEQEELFYKIELPLIEALADMELAGIRIDLAILASLSDEFHGRLLKLTSEIYKIAGKEFNINSPKQLRLILFEKLNLPVIKRTKTGPSTDEEVLNKLAKTHNLPVLILDYRQLVKLKSTYIDALPELVDARDGKLHSFFNQTGTETGRLSSARPNLQNIPVKSEEGRRIRLAFIPDKPDDFLFACDYSQIELRILAHLSQDDNLIRAFREDKDVHRYTASLIFNQAEDKVSEEMRDTAKRVNFGIIYGISSFGLSKDLGISPEEAGRFIEEYFLRYPQVKRYIDETIAQAKKDGFVSTLLGRRRYLKEINSPNNQLRAFAERQAINAPIQGTASDIIKLAMVNIHSALKKKALRSKIILQVHDELIFNADKDELGVLAKLARDCMENVLALSIPIKVEAKYGKNWNNLEILKT